MRKFSLLIDKITNSIEDAITGKKFDTDITLLLASDLKMVQKKHGWRFNWKREFNYKNRQLYKIVIKGDTTIQGLLSLAQMENYIEMQLIETAPHNYGNSKKYVGVPANLVAYACKMSFDSGFEGFVGFKAKTKLIKHYIDTLGAELVFRDRMSISGSSAKKLVNLYYKNYLDGR